MGYLERLFLRDNFRKLIFRSEAAMNEFLTSVPFVSAALIEKSSVVYPAIRPMDTEIENKRGDDSINLLFSGFFFRKGGASVVDAFCRLQQVYPGLKLRLCCDPDLDFETPNKELRDEYLLKIRNNPSIVLGRVPRATMLEHVLPQTDIFVMPTYNEAFGFAILEAMAHGIPVVSTRHFAIPEMVEHNQNGLLVDFATFDVAKLFPGYVVTEIPTGFHNLVTDQLENFLSILVSSREMRLRFGLRAREIISSKFSIEERNRVMSNIYRSAIA
jgi:glycosyltransferase involved in cell wall biosynthesis